MKVTLKKMIIALLIFILIATFTYLVSTLSLFYKWCNKNQLFINSDNILELDSEKIQQIGDKVGLQTRLLKESLKETNKDENVHSIAEYYDPLGFAVWSFMQNDVKTIFTVYIEISIILGATIAIAYIIITSKRINNILKFIIGYVSIILSVNILLWYRFYHSFNKAPFRIYCKSPSTKIFFVVYTVIFILIYVINYRVGAKMAKDLNESIKENKNEN